MVAGADDALWRIRLRGDAVEVTPLPPHAEADHPRVEDDIRPDPAVPADGHPGVQDRAGTNDSPFADDAERPD